MICHGWPGNEKNLDASESTLAVVRRLLGDHGRLLGLMFLVIAASTVSNAVGTNMPVYAQSTLGLTEAVSTAVPIALGLASVLPFHCSAAGSQTAPGAGR